ncbi:hypothetical protein EBZ39_03205 [bacterium]|nr:hypothetical protein [bacterium]
MDITPVLTQMGWAGILALAVAYVFRELSQAQKLRIDALEDLVLRLEARATACEEDRLRLHQTLTEVKEELRRITGNK